MALFSRTPLTPAEQAAKDRQKAQRAREKAEWRAAQAERERERLENLPYFVVQEIRAVTVQASNMADAISLAAAAFKEGQNSDHTIKWHKPWGVDGNTVDEIKSINVRAFEVDPRDVV